MIHIYKSRGYNIVLDVNSGAVHAVSDAAYALLEKYPDGLPEKLCEPVDGFGEEELLEAHAELLELVKNGLLFSDDDYIDLEKVHFEQSPVKAMCLHIAHDCNLKCEYCFADGGEYHQIRQLMSFEVGKAAIDFLIAHSGKRRNLEIDFFGGEPLLNFEVVKQIVEYAESLEKRHDKNFRFTITTNGVLLTEDKMAYINEHMGNIVLSLDGRKEVNDRVRRRLDGSGCYDSILPKFQKMAELRNQDNYYVRGTFTRYNKDFDRDVLHLADLGFRQISVEPVTAPESAPYSLRECDLPEVMEAYDRLCDAMVERRKRGERFNFFHFMIDLDQGPCVIKRLRGCGSGNEYVAVTPSGDIYPCHQFVGMEGYRMGSVLDGSFDEKIKTTFSKANVYTKPECKNCWCKFYCSGGCNANNLQYGGDILSPYRIGCELQKKRVECAIALKFEEA